MNLWNDYEGKTVATFPLKKLLRPEGRSAFFTTSEGEGRPAVLRLTESVNDQDELFERWHHITVAAQPNLIDIKRFGTVAYDGVPLTYALLEAPDASLAEILAERPLTLAESLQVAIAVTTALRALHNISFIHEHIEPASIYAVGETIKLRSDCVRECITDPEFNPEELCQERRQRDIHDLGVLLLRCLTLEKSQLPTTRLPAPFDQVIPRAIDGSWTLCQIANALTPPTAKRPVPAEAIEAAKAEVTPEPVAVGESRAMLLAEDAPVQQELPLRSYAEPKPATSREFPVWARNPRVWIASGVALLMLFLITHIHPAPTEAAVQQTTTAASTHPAPSTAVVPAATAAPETQPGWRVIVFTYTKEAQAFAKAASIQSSHPDLQAQVFAHHHQKAPFLVSLGGPMSRAEADAMLQRARRAGLPRDSFVRLYNS